MNIASDDRTEREHSFSEHDSGLAFEQGHGESLFSCRFCGHYAEGDSDSVDAPWLKDSDYFAIVSKGALVPGWSLVCPATHHVNLARQYSSSRFWTFAARAAAIVGRRYGTVRVFEHGPSREGSLTGCGADHAHLHLAPLSFEISVAAKRQDASLEWRTCRAADVKQKANGSEYLFVSDNFAGEETSGILCLLDSPRSQFFRRVIADTLGVAHLYDYKRHPMLDIGLASREALVAEVKAAGDSGAR